MLTKRISSPTLQRGMSMIEVLVSILILAFGLLGLAGLNLHIQAAELESFQRSQALLVLNDMVERMTVNRAQAGAYVSADTFGTGDSQPADCSGLAVNTPQRDQCDWSALLKGSAEKLGATKIGAMIGARGCITLVQAADAATRTPGIYRVAVAWQGTRPTRPPAVTCGQSSYGAEDNLRRLLSIDITVGIPTS